MDLAVPSQEVVGRSSRPVPPIGSYECRYCQDTGTFGGIGGFFTNGHADVPCPRCSPSAYTIYEFRAGDGTLCATYSYGPTDQPSFDTSAFPAYERFQREFLGLRPES